MMRTNVRRLTSDHPLGTPVLVITVLKPGQVGDYAAYQAAIIGDRYVPEIHDEWVAQHGDKVYFDEARTIFPEIETKRYRR
jgi:hypothetical protein